MIKNWVIPLLILFGVIYFFTDYGKKIEEYFLSDRAKIEKSEDMSPAGEEASSKNMEDYFPLTEGKIWRYVTSHSTRRKWKLTITNIHQIELKQKQTFPKKYEFVNGGVSTSYIIYIAKDHESIYHFAKGSSRDIEPRMYEPIYLIKRPIKVGANWKRHNTSGIIEGVNEEVTVPAGTFKGCVKVKTTFDRGAQTIQWLAPGIGLVMIYYKYPDKRRDLEFLLESYK